LLIAHEGGEFHIFDGMDTRVVDGAAVDPATVRWVAMPAMSRDRHGHVGSAGHAVYSLAVAARAAIRARSADRRSTRSRQIDAADLRLLDACTRQVITDDSTQPQSIEVPAARIARSICWSSGLSRVRRA
jgi:hypothetical protein